MPIFCLGNGVGPAQGLGLGLSGRTLALHEDGDFEDWGLSLSLDYDPSPATQRGFSARLSHDVGGASSGGVQALLGPNVFPELARARAAGRGERRWPTG